MPQRPGGNRHPALGAGPIRRRGQPPVQNQGRGGASFAAERKRLRYRTWVLVSQALLARPGVSIATGQGSREEVRKRRLLDAHRRTWSMTDVGEGP